jgi:hypothetical protein
VWHAVPVPRGPSAVCATILAVGLALSGCSAPKTAVAGPDLASPAVPSLTPSPTPTPSPELTTPPPSPSPTKATPKPPTTRPATTTTRATPQWTYAPSGGPAAGTGTAWRYRIAVETGVAVSIGDLTAVVNSTLDDPRSWIAGGIQFQQVGPGDSAQFTVWLASPSTAYSMCLAAGVDIRVGGVPYTSCRAGNNVVLNSSRYLNAVPNYPLAPYRQYMVNHEVGHRLGHGHELCPGAGKPAPVMEQQTLGLQGCVAYSWPYLGGVLYSGPTA